MAKPSVMPELYTALFEISVMRREVQRLRRLGKSDAARLMSRLEAAERSALRILDAIESNRPPTDH